MQSSGILQYASEQVTNRLGKLTFQIVAASKGANSESVHDLRVAIRRFDESLTMFATLYPDAATKKIRKSLRLLRKAAGLVRDRDIALEFLSESGVEKEDALWARIAGERKVAEYSLAKLLIAWNEKGTSRKWRSDLHLSRS